MTLNDKSLHASTDITLGNLLEAIAASPDSPLVFLYDGAAIRSGYHVTEVKAGRFAALDCGANPEAWAEIFVQLWDVEDGGRTHMPAGKFAAIVRKVSEHVRLDDGAKLTFEVSDGVRPMQLYCAAAPVTADGTLHVELLPRAASCKPRDRWLAEKAARDTACCDAAAKTSCCA